VTSVGPLPAPHPALPAHIKTPLAASGGPVTSLNKDIFHLPNLNESEFKVV